MSRLVSILVLALLPSLASCSGLLVKDESGETKLDLVVLAENIAALRQDVIDIASVKAEPETQARIAELSAEVEKVEAALVAASKDGAIGDVRSAAAAALTLADAVLSELQASGKDVGDLPFYVALTKVALRHLAAGQTDEAQKELEQPKPVSDGAEDGPR